MSFWDIIWFIIVSYVFIAYLMLLFRIIGDVMRDHSLSGLAKALWMITLICVPFVTALVYLITRGAGMAERQGAEVADSLSRQQAYIRSVAGGSPAAEIASAKDMLDWGSIDAAEFDAIKTKALAT